MLPANMTTEEMKSKLKELRDTHEAIDEKIKELNKRLKARPSLKQACLRKMHERLYDCEHGMLRCLNGWGTSWNGKINMNEFKLYFRLWLGVAEGSYGTATSSVEEEEDERKPSAKDGAGKKDNEKTMRNHRMVTK